MRKHGILYEVTVTNSDHEKAVKCFDSQDRQEAQSVFEDWASKLGLRDCVTIGSVDYSGGCIACCSIDARFGMCYNW